MTRTLAILPWGDVIEEFLEPIDLTREDFVERMSGGWLFGYVAALTAAGWRCVIVCPSETVAAPTLAIHRATGSRMWFVPGRRAEADWGTTRRGLQQWWRTPIRSIRQVLLEERCHVVLCQEYEYARFDVLVLLCQLLNLPLYASFQGGDRTLSRVESIVRVHSLQRSAGLIVASRDERDRLERAYPTLRVPVASIPNPINTTEWRATARDAARQALGIPSEVFLVVNHGRIDIHRKGLDVLLAAWRQFSVNRSFVRLHLIGSGQDQQRFESLLAMQGTADVTWDGIYTNDRARIRQWLSAADAYIMTSRTEGMPVAPLEAMACGLPVVASRAQGMPDILEQGERSGGILVSCEDPSAAALALGTLADDPRLRLAMGRAARQTVEHRFSTQAVGAQLAAFLTG